MDPMWNFEHNPHLTLYSMVPCNAEWTARRNLLRKAWTEATSTLPWHQAAKQTLTCQLDQQMQC